MAFLLLPFLSDAISLYLSLCKVGRIYFFLDIGTFLLSILQRKEPLMAAGTENALLYRRLLRRIFRFFLCSSRSVTGFRTESPISNDQFKWFPSPFSECVQYCFLPLKCLSSGDGTAYSAPMPLSFYIYCIPCLHHRQEKITRDTIRAL